VQSKADAEYWIFVPIFSLVMIVTTILISKYIARKEKRKRLKRLKYDELEEMTFNRFAFEFYNTPDGIKMLIAQGDHAGAIKALSQWLKECADKAHKARVKNHLV
jgi:hypothetical protein